jgi:hypothetical protein
MPRAWLIALLLFLTACTGPEVARAPEPQSAIDWWPGSERVFEHDDGWVLQVVLDTRGKPTPASHLPLRFELDMRVFYERQDVDGQMVTRALDVEDAFTHSVTQNVCFRSTANASGRFMVPIRVERNDGFRPGEYDVRVVRVDTGEVLGSSARLTLHRRSGSALTEAAR